VIKWEEGRLPAIVEQAEQALLAMPQLNVFQRGPMLVRPARAYQRTVRDVARPYAVSPTVRLIEQPLLVEVLTRAAHWLRYDKRRGANVEVNCPKDVAATYLANVGHWRLRHLAGVISAPTLRPDGSILQNPGYDDATGVYLDPCGVDFPAVPDRPTRKQAQQALTELQWPLREFPFLDEVDESVALALVLTSLVRRSLPTAPMGAITAPVMASGKTLLADYVSIIATGASAAAVSFPASEEEAEKVALATLIAGEPIMLLDNVERPLEGAWLCSILTSETYSGRWLGRSEMVSVPSAILVLATGNQLSLVGDLRTRALLCRIDPRIEHPEQRSFDWDLRVWATAHRPEVVAAGLTVMRAYLTSGAKVQMPQWGRFERWSQMVRAPLLWLDQPDPCANLKQLEDEDPQRAELLQVMEAWHAAFGNEKHIVREVVDWALRETDSDSSVGTLREALQQVALDRGQINSRRLGRWLLRNADRICAGRQFQRAGERQGVVQWQLINIGDF
jgi:hypothetical protein